MQGFRVEPDITACPECEVTCGHMPRKCLYSSLNLPSPNLPPNILKRGYDPLRQFQECLFRLLTDFHSGPKSSINSIFKCCDDQDREFVFFRKGGLHISVLKIILALVCSGFSYVDKTKTAMQLLLLDQSFVSFVTSSFKHHQIL